MIAAPAGMLGLGAATAPAEAPSIDPANLSRHIQRLASDEFEGRGPGTAGEQRTVNYIVEQFRSAGLSPGGDDGEWTQSVPMNRMTTPASATLTVQGGPDCSFDLGNSALLWTRNPAPRVDISEAELVFAGYGIIAPEARWNDYAGADVRGKVVIVLPNDPDRDSATGPFGGPALSYYGRLATKAELAARAGALAVIAVHDEAASGYAWPLLQSLYSTPALALTDAEESRLRFSSWLRADAAARLFQCAGLDLEAQRRAAASPDFRAVPLAGVRVAAHFPVSVESAVTHNVIGYLPGSGRPDETFVYTAHWDHLGRGRPDSTGDTIYNGALDNAGGVAGLIELARVFAAEPRASRSLVFIATTLEESGLLGAEYYAAHPRFPLELTVGGINMDAVNLFGATGTMEVTGMGRTTLEDFLRAELVRTGRVMRDDPNSVVGFYFRSDHFPFVKRGVPFLFAGSGWELADERAKNTRDPQLGSRFHQPSDEWSADLDFAAAARDLRLYHAVGTVLANSAEWPRWLPGTEFEAIRARSEAARRATGSGARAARHPIH